MKITKPSDLKPGYKWLGLTVDEVGPGGDVWFKGSVATFSMGRYTAQALIDAGNDEVERDDAEIVTCCGIERVWYEDVTLGEYIPVPASLGGHGPLQVAISTQPFKAVRPKAEGFVLQANSLPYHCIDGFDGSAGEWLYSNAKPGDTILVVSNDS